MNDAGAGPGWEVDKSSSVSPVNLLRRSLFKSGSTDNRVNFFPEPYDCDTIIRGSGTLLRASWSADAYFGYGGRTVLMQYRQDPGAYSPGNIVDVDETSASGAVDFADRIGGPDGPPCGGPLVFRGVYPGNGTTSGTVSIGDRIVPAP